MENKKGVIGEKVEHTAYEIVRFIGHQQPVPMLLEDLSRLEYRNYDSAEYVVLDGEDLAELTKLLVS